MQRLSIYAVVLLMVLISSCANQYRNNDIKSVTPLYTPQQVLSVSYRNPNCSIVAGGWHSKVNRAGYRVCWHEVRNCRVTPTHGCCVCSKYEEGRCTSWEWHTFHYDR